MTDHIPRQPPNRVLVTNGAAPSDSWGDYDLQEECTQGLGTCSQGNP